MLLFSSARLPAEHQLSHRWTHIILSYSVMMQNEWLWAAQPGGQEANPDQNLPQPSAHLLCFSEDQRLARADTPNVSSCWPRHLNITEQSAVRSHTLTVSAFSLKQQIPNETFKSGKIQWLWMIGEAGFRRGVCPKQGALAPLFDLHLHPYDRLVTSLFRDELWDHASLQTSLQTSCIIKASHSAACFQFSFLPTAETVPEKAALRRPHRCCCFCAFNWKQ